MSDNAAPGATVTHQPGAHQFRDFSSTLGEICAITAGKKVAELDLESRDGWKIINWLGDPFIRREDDLSRVQDAYEGRLAGGGEDAQRAVLGFFGLVRSAEEFAEDGHKPNSESAASASGFLEDAAVISFLNNLYRLDDRYRLRAGETQLWRTGTTSIILLSENVRAVKIIKPRFLHNPTIERETANYRFKFTAREFGRSVPRIYSSNERYVVMDYCQGVTLSEFADSYLWCLGRGRPKSRRTADELELILSVTRGVIRCLKENAARPDAPTYHLDLSPENVLIDSSQLGRVVEVRDIKLIDFGVNYALKTVIAARRDLQYLHSYISPEVSRGDENADYRSDVYSVGVILLEMLRGSRLEPHDIPDALDKVYLAHSGLAKIVERMISGEPVRRVRDRAAGRAYDGLAEDIRIEIEDAVGSANKKVQVFAKAARFLQIFISVDLWVFVQSALELVRGASYMAIWRLLAGLTSVSALAVVVRWAMSAGTWTDAVLPVALPALLMTSAMVLLVGGYYQKVLSRISARRLSTLGEIAIRASAFANLPLFLCFLYADRTSVFGHTLPHPLFWYWPFAFWPAELLLAASIGACWFLGKRALKDKALIADLGEERLEVFSEFIGSEETQSFVMASVMALYGGVVFPMIKFTALRHPEAVPSSYFFQNAELLVVSASALVMLFTHVISTAVEGSKFTSNLDRLFTRYESVRGKKE